MADEINAIRPGAERAAPRDAGRQVTIGTNASASGAFWSWPPKSDRAGGPILSGAKVDRFMFQDSDDYPTKEESCRSRFPAGRPATPTPVSAGGNPAAAPGAKGIYVTRSESVHRDIGSRRAPRKPTVRPEAAHRLRASRRPIYLAQAPGARDLARSRLRDAGRREGIGRTCCARIIVTSKRNSRIDRIQWRTYSGLGGVP